MKERISSIAVKVDDLIPFPVMSSLISLYKIYKKYLTNSTTLLGALPIDMVRSNHVNR